MDLIGQLHAPSALPTVKNPRYPLARTLGGRGGDEEKFKPLPGFEPSSSSPGAELSPRRLKQEVQGRKLSFICVPRKESLTGTLGVSGTRT
jgi:hypothetical protein